MQETQVLSLIWEDPLEKGMATHFSILAWRIPWTEEPGRLLYYKIMSHEDPLEKGMATHFSFLVWRIPWLQSMEGCKESETIERLTFSLSWEY